MNEPESSRSLVLSVVSLNRIVAGEGRGMGAGAGSVLDPADIVHSIHGLCAHQARMRTWRWARTALRCGFRIQTTASTRRPTKCPSSSLINQLMCW